MNKNRLCRLCCRKLLRKAVKAKSKNNRKLTSRMIQT